MIFKVPFNSTGLDYLVLFWKAVFWFCFLDSNIILDAYTDMKCFISETKHLCGHVHTWLVALASPGWFYPRWPFAVLDCTQSPWDNTFLQERAAFSTTAPHSVISSFSSLESGRYRDKKGKKILKSYTCPSGIFKASHCFFPKCLWRFNKRAFPFVRDVSGEEHVSDTSITSSHDECL